MPTDFLKSRHRTFLAETSGDTTVIFQPFNSGTADTLTGDNPGGYGATIRLPGRIDNLPTRVARELQGQNISYDAVVRMSVQDFSSKGIVPKPGDIITLPGETKPSYITKVVPQKQSGSEFLEYLITVSRRTSGRGL